MLILRLVFMLCQKICYAIYVYIYIKCQFSMCYLKNIWRKKKLKVQIFLFFSETLSMYVLLNKSCSFSGLVG